MTAITIGTEAIWVSAKGYTSPEGQLCEVYRIDPATRRAAINTDANDGSGPYSMSVSFDELHPTMHPTMPTEPTYDFFCDNGGEVIIPVAEFERDCERVTLRTVHIYGNRPVEFVECTTRLPDGSYSHEDVSPQS